MSKATKRSGATSKARAKIARGHGGKVHIPGVRKAKRDAAKRHRGTVDKAAARYKGDLFEAIHSSASDLHAVGAIGKQTMREYDALCIEPPKELSARNIKELRESLNMSQPIFARRIYVSPSTVAKWEAGANKPSGIALKYLNVLKRLGAEALD
jgi:putative transcriptional regulator